MAKDFIKSPLNYTVGKYKLLPQIILLFPGQIDTFVDLFCGGANVGVNICANKVIYNDSNSKLVGLIRNLGKYRPEQAVKKVEEIIALFGLSNSIENGYEFYNCNSGAGLGSYNKLPFQNLRQEFNQLSKKDNKYNFYLFTLIIFAFNNQICFNSKGQYNLPVGKRDFNSNIRKNLTRFIAGINAQNAEFSAKHFSRIDISELGENDLVYCDPPYLITTASYNEMGGWTAADERELLSFLDILDERNVKFALSNVTQHKGKENTILIEWAQKYHIHNLSFNYSNSSYHGKDTEKKTQEVLITNYLV